MIKVSVFIATSLDGFIARKNGDIKWLHNSGHGEVAKNEDFGYENFMSTIDAMVMGRNTYETVFSFANDWPYGDKPVFVLTSYDVEIPDEIVQTVTTLTGSPSQIIKEMERLGHQHIYLDGEVTIPKFLADGLVNSLIISLQKFPFYLAVESHLPGHCQKKSH